MSWKQFEEWKIYESLEPFDETRADYRAAQIVTALVNIHRDRKKKRSPYKMEDIVLLFGDSEAPPKKAQTWQEQKNIGKMFASMFNAIEQSKAEKKAKRKRR